MASSCSENCTVAPTPPERETPAVYLQARFCEPSRCAPGSRRVMRLGSEHRPCQLDQEGLTELFEWTPRDLHTQSAISSLISSAVCLEWQYRIPVSYRRPSKHRADSVVALIHRPNPRIRVSSRQYDLGLWICCNQLAHEERALPIRCSLVRSAHMYSIFSHSTTRVNAHRTVPGAYRTQPRRT